MRYAAVAFLLLATGCSDPEPATTPSSDAGVDATAGDTSVSADTTTTPDAVTSTDTAPGPDTVSPSGCTVFPGDNLWNTRIDGLPVHPNSDNFVASIGASTAIHPDFGTFWQGAPIGIPYSTVPGDQPLVDVDFSDGYPDESDPGPYAFPPDALVEGGPDASGDRHVIAVDMDNCLLYETFATYPDGDGTWTAVSGAIWDMTSNAYRPIGWTSADAAGLPIYPGLVRRDEVLAGYIGHALRFTVSTSQRAIVLPATHWASSNTDPDTPPMGLRFRLKTDFDISGYTPNVQVIMTALKEFGMIVADNGSDWFISGAHDPQWDDDELRQLKDLQGSDFEAVDTGPIYTDYGAVP